VREAESVVATGGYRQIRAPALYPGVPAQLRQLHRDVARIVTRASVLAEVEFSECVTAGGRIFFRVVDVQHGSDFPNCTEKEVHAIIRARRTPWKPDDS
jgi:hypothetical protein